MCERGFFKRKNRRELNAVRGDVVEAGGVEPPSESTSTAFSTSVVHDYTFPPLRPRGQGRSFSSLINPTRRKA